MNLTTFKVNHQNRIKCQMNSKAFYCLITLLLTLGYTAPAVQAADKPNILVIMSDDVGITNISAYSR